ncbi:MAG: ATP synthase F0 subunit B [Deltaproteobacteria bacterium]|nr:ATP synthase F0 subunit B [Deltaproteobacteria bacterium]
MNLRNNRCLMIFFLFLGASAIMILLIPDAFAGEGISTGRKIWDNILLWINFGILVYFFLKYGKQPLKDFIHGERNKIDVTLNTADEKLNKAKSVLDEESDSLKDIDGRLQELKKSIIEMGQKEKEKAIETAKTTANQMMEDAKKESQYKLAMARKALKDEMVEIAISLVEGRLKEKISLEDDRILVNQFIDRLDTSRRYFD